jgi:hypothetical protein
MVLGFAPWHRGWLFNCIRKAILRDIILTLDGPSVLGFAMELSINQSIANTKFHLHLHHLRAT